MASSFVHLHLRTQFSLLDGTNQIEPLVQQIKSFGQPAVAMIDHPLISALITVLPIDTPV